MPLSSRLPSVLASSCMSDMGMSPLSSCCCTLLCDRCSSCTPLPAHRAVSAIYVYAAYLCNTSISSFQVLDASSCITGGSANPPLNPCLLYFLAPNPQ